MTTTPGFLRQTLPVKPGQDDVALIRGNFNVNVNHISGVSMGAGPASSPYMETGNGMKTEP